MSVFTLSFVGFVIVLTVGVLVKFQRSKFSVPSWAQTLWRSLFALTPPPLPTEPPVVLPTVNISYAVRVQDTVSLTPDLPFMPVPAPVTKTKTPRAKKTTVAATTPKTQKPRKPRSVRSARTS